VKTSEKHYKELQSALLKNKGIPKGYFSTGYGGNADLSLHITNPVLHKIAKDFVKSHKDISLEDLVEMIHLLYKGKYDDEKQLSGKILMRYKDLKKQFDPKHLDEWLENAVGWSQVDSLCQSTFGIDDLSKNWNKWKKTLVKFSNDKNVSKRRASLVLLIRTLRETSEEKYSKLALEFVDKLKHEKDILITKAISWILREMTKNHRDKVKSYLGSNENSLPKIAVRETRRKLETGRK